MRVLTINHHMASPDVEIINSANLENSTPFGFDLIIIDPNGHHYGGSVISTARRWKDSLDEWLKEGHTVVTLLNPGSLIRGNTDNYSWLPYDEQFLRFENCGSSSELGEIVATDPSLRELLDEGDFVINTHVKDNGAATTQTLSRVSSTKITAFKRQYGAGQILFIPRPTNSDQFLSKLIPKMGSQTSWVTNALLQHREELNDVAKQQLELSVKQKDIEGEIALESARINTVIQNDIFLKRAVRNFETAKSAENPDPDNYYEALESLERAYGSERKMREKLGITKNESDLVMRRTNEFRHVSDSGDTPQPLSLEERAKFHEIIEKAISAHIELLLEDKRQNKTPTDEG